MMPECDIRYEMVCKNEFGRLHSKANSIDTALRGNGGPGIVTRLDRLEQTRSWTRDVAFLLGGAAAGFAVRFAVAMIAGGSS